MNPGEETVSWQNRMKQHKCGKKQPTLLVTQILCTLKEDWGSGRAAAEGVSKGHDQRCHELRHDIGKIEIRLRQRSVRSCTGESMKSGQELICKVIIIEAENGTRRGLRAYG